MLVSREPEECIIQKVFFYGAVMLLILYVLKLIRYFVNSRKLDYYEKANKRTRNSNSHQNLAQKLEPISEEKRGRKKQRRKRQYHCVQEHWLPKHEPCQCREFDE